LEILLADEDTMRLVLTIGERAIGEWCCVPVKDRMLVSM
jgi:hypothetical protein